MDILSNENSSFYLINPNWINKLKEFFNYNKIFDTLNQLNLDINFAPNISNNNIDNITKLFLKDNNINCDDNILEILGDYNLINSIDIKLNKEFFNKSVIIPIKIVNVISYLFFENKNIQLFQIQLLSKDEDIYIFFKNNIEIGYINEKLIFIPKYYLYFNSINIFKQDKKTILANKNEDYIKFRKCFNYKYEPQSLINQYKQSIGFLIVLPNKNIKYKNKSVFNKKKIPKNSKVKNNRENISFNINRDKFISSKTPKREKNNKINSKQNNNNKNSSFGNNYKMKEEFIKQYLNNSKDDENIDEENTEDENNRGTINILNFKIFYFN